MTISRRTLAKGTVWAAPVVMVSAAAPAIAASPQCQRFVSGQPLPAAAFEVTYINITNETGPSQMSMGSGVRGDVPERVL
ncbi:hypothetical protein RF638_14840 [Kocuria sp. CPCC 205235]|uniref:hypothetical protein n=1 Tax=Kocuria sp. CPCC 205235 TaxID=3073549 RepID=UPI0034D43A0D